MARTMEIKTKNLHVTTEDATYKAGDDKLYIPKGKLENINRYLMEYLNPQYNFHQELCCLMRDEGG